MDIGPVLNFNGLFQACDQAPEFSLDVIFSNRARAIEDWVEGHFVLEVALFEICSFLLELLKRVDATFLEAELAIANETSRAVPIVIWLVGDLRVKAVGVVAVVA
jgi:hypothetical protein